VLRRRVRALGEDARDGDDVDDVRARLEARQEGERRPDRAKVVDVDHELDPLGVAVEVVRAAGDACVVDEQIDARVALEDTCRSRFDGGTVADVARLVLICRRRRPREADYERASALERLHDLGPDARRGAGEYGYLGYLQILILRAEAAVLPAASVSVAASRWVPFAVLPVFQAKE
jgi:hypothetical protein